MAVLRSAGAQAAATGPDVLTINAMPAGRIVALLAANSIPFTEVSPHQASLEEAYMALTSDAVEFRAAPGERGGPMTRPGAAPDPAGFAHLLHAEWTKFRTVRGWVIAVVAGLVAIVFLGWFSASGSHCLIQGPQHPVALACPSPPVGPGGEFVTDNFYLVRRALAGNGSITVRVTSLTGRYNPNGQVPPGEQDNPLAGMVPGVQPWAKAGIIITDGTQHRIGLRGDDGHRRLRGANAVGLHPGLARPGRPRLGGVTALAPADPLRRHDHRVRLGRRHALGQGRHRHPGRAAAHGPGRDVRHLAGKLPGQHPVTRRGYRTGRPHRSHRGLGPCQPATEAGEAACGPARSSRPATPW